MLGVQIILDSWAYFGEGEEEHLSQFKSRKVCKTTLKGGLFLINPLNYEYQNSKKYKPQTAGAEWRSCCGWLWNGFYHSI